MIRTLKIKEKILSFFQLFFSIYFILYVFPFPLISLPAFFDSIIIWFWEKFLNLGFLEKIKLTGSGDTTFDFAIIIFLFAVTIIISVILKFFIKKDKALERILLFSISYGKYYLAFNLLTYGFAKINYGQFPFPDLMRLDQRVGEISPMGLLWTFMGYSKTYSLFSAICEITAGILLLIRRTTVLGGLLSFAIMLNIVILNFSYDVPVKLFSIHLTLISIFVIHQNLFNLLSFFTGHTAKIDFNRIELKNKWLKTGRILFIVLILSSVITPFYYQISSQKTPPDSDNNLNGIYSMESFNVNGDSVNTDGKWSKLIIDNERAKIFLVDHSVLHAEHSVFYYEAKTDSKKQTITLKSDRDSTNQFHLKYNRKQGDLLELSGVFESDTIKGNFKIKRKNDFQLMKRKFNWIHEYPYNR